MNDPVAKLREYFSILPGGVVRSNSGTTIDVSSNGTTSVPAKDLEKIVFDRFREMSAAGHATELAAKR
jgi:hypothetical protein